MADVIDLAKMKPRVAAAEAILSSAAKKGERHSARLLERLDALQETLAEKQQQIRNLEDVHGRTLEELEKLRARSNGAAGTPSATEALVIPRKTGRLAKAATYLGFAGWLAAAAVAADKVHGDAVVDALEGALVRSQVARNELSKELTRISAELEALRKRQTYYDTRTRLTTATP